MQDFQIGRGVYGLTAHLTSTKSEVPLYGQGGSIRILDAFSCYLSLILKHSDTKRNNRNGQSILFFWGGGGGGGGIAGQYFDNIEIMRYGKNIEYPNNDLMIISIYRGDTI